jgi:hypothetical protein
MNLRCKVFRAGEAGELEEAINRFFGEELTELGEAVQFEEITQSEGPGGVTVVVWYTLLEEADEILDADAPLEPYDEGGKELA